MMITGRQIRVARDKVGWTQTDLSLRARVPVPDIARAESVDDTPSITLDYGRSIQQAFEQAGLQISQDGSVSVDPFDPF